MRLEQIEKVLDKLYEDNALGAIEQDRYEQMSQKYSEEYYTLKTELEEPTEQEIRQMREEIEEAKKEKRRAYHRNYARLSQRRDERQDHNPDKGMENRVCQTDRREENKWYLALKEEMKEAEKIRKSVYSILRQEQRER